MSPHRGEPRPLLLLTGAGGMLGGMFRLRMPAYYELHACDHAALDITDAARVNELVERLRPRVIVNCAAFARVDDCEQSRELALRVNGEGPGILARAAHQVGAVLVHISTDYVFDGCKKAPYVEEDAAAPLSVYGLSKLRGEQAVAASGLTRFFIVRTSWLYGPGGGNFVETIIRLAKEREELRIVADQIGCPTYTRDLVLAVFRLLDTPRHLDVGQNGDPYGIYHFAGAGQCSWFEFAEDIVTLLRRHEPGPAVKRILPIRTEDYPLPAARPRWSVLSTEKYQRLTGAVVPHWRQSLQDYFEARFA
ncbi:dTDP-4-dehydrorhamnose reductase [Geoalkalibacter sp.]|uniref:dTDP-4-dehydrorhamnose reductase n=1 Tax=Geoalkalibacter sp. TaxID=3041440 RepID=UPI00272EE34E|nr:dTDP-4-dehydrorhamnose reductase [Geoalkalibacter sp.]